MFALKNDTYNGEGAKNFEPGRRVSIFRMIREDLNNNIGTLLLGLLAVIFSMPVFMALSLSDIKSSMERYMLEAHVSADGPTSAAVESRIEDYTKRMTEAADSILTGSTGLMAVIVVVAAVICARMLFNYLMSRPTVDHYFSQSVTRDKRFAANYISGALIMLICTVAGYIPALIVAAAYGVRDIAVVESLVAMTGFLLVFLLLYTTFIIAMLLTGRPFASVAAALVINLFGIGIYAIVNVYYNFFGTYLARGGIMKMLYYASPLYYLVRLHGQISGRHGICSKESYMLLALIFAGCVALVAIAVLLHRRRPAEACGRTLAFSWTKRPLRILLSIEGGLVFSFFGVEQSGIFWTFFFVIAGIAIMHAISEAVFNADIRTILNHKLETVACIGAGVLFASVFIFDLFNYDGWVPETSEVTSIGLDYSAFFMERRAIVESDYDYEYIAHIREDGEDNMFYSEEYWENYPDLMEDMAITETEYIEAALKLCSVGAEKEEGINYIKPSLYYETLYEYEGGDLEYSMDVVYRLKNGSERYRHYVFTETELLELMPEVYRSHELKMAMYPILELSEDDIGLFGIEYKDPLSAELAISRGTISGAAMRLTPTAHRNYDYNESRIYDLNDDEDLKKELLSALKKDIEEMEFRDYYEWYYRVYSRYDEDGNKVYDSTSEQYKGEQMEGTYLLEDVLYYVPSSSEALAGLRNKGMTVEQSYDGSWYYYEYTDTYPIFESFENVRELLESRGVTEREKL